jgi:ribA/ribD-fused uncharacterized protein
MKSRQYFPIAIWVVSLFIIVSLVLYLLNALTINFILGFLVGIFSVISIMVLIDNKITLMEWFYVENKSSDVDELGVIHDGVIRVFENEFAFLSNSYQTPFRIDGVSYVNVEQYYHSMKTQEKKQREKILSTDDPHVIYKLGRKCSLRKDWDSVKTKYMRRAITAKFSQNKDIRDKLIATKDLELENGIAEKDGVWGISIYTHQGENLLGKMLMELRERLLSD